MPLSQPPPPPAADHSTGLFLQVCGGTVAAVGQTVVVLRTHHGRSAAQIALALMPAAVLFLPLVLLPVLLPRLWARHGAAVAASTRVAFFSLPHVQGQKGAFKVLQGQPSSAGGLLALAKDLFRLIVGTRCLVIAGFAFLTAVSTPVPLVVDLALQLYALRRSFDADLVCASPMLRHPTWQRRISSTHSFLNMFQLLTVGAVVPASLGSASMAEAYRHASDADRCRVFVNFVGLLYPLVGSLLISARIHRGAPRRAEWRTRWRASVPCSRRGGGSGGPAGGGSSRGWLLRCLRCCSCVVALGRHAVTVTDEWLEAACSFSWCEGSWLGFLAWWCPLLSVLWMVAGDISAS